MIKKRKHVRTPKQKAAFKKMISALHRKKSVKRHKRVTRRVPAGKHTDQIIIMGDSMKKHRKTKRHVKRSYLHGSRRKVHRRKRHYMHGFRGVGKNAVMESLVFIAGGTAGAIVAGFASSFIPASVSQRIKALIITAAGVGLGVSPFAKHKMVKAASIGISIIGASSLIRTFATGIPSLGIPASPGAYSLLGIPADPAAYRLSGRVPQNIKITEMAGYDFPTGSDF